MAQEMKRNGKWGRLTWSILSRCIGSWAWKPRQEAFSYWTCQNQQTQTLTPIQALPLTPLSKPPPPPLPALLAPPTEENNGVLLKAFPLRSSPFQTTGLWIHGKSNWVCPKTSPFSLLTNTVLNKPHPLPPPIYWQTSALKKILTFRKPAVLLLFMNGMLMNDVERISNQNN